MAFNDEPPDRKEETNSAPRHAIRELPDREVTEPDAEQVKGGKVSSTDFSFTKKVDKSSPTL